MYYVCYRDSSPMNITINGHKKEIEKISFLGDVVSEFCRSKLVIAEHNGVVVKNRDWAQTPVKDGDTIELVTFVGGG